MAVDKRPVRAGEVRAVVSADHRLVVSVCQRPDGLFCFYADELEYVEESNADFWQFGPLETGLFGTADEAEQEARARYKGLGASGS